MGEHVLVIISKFIWRYKCNVVTDAPALYLCSTQISYCSQVVDYRIENYSSLTRTGIFASQIGNSADVKKEVSMLARVLLDILTRSTLLK